MKNLPLSLRQLDTFLAVARTGSFHGAARQLNSTQPAVSTRIAQLEQTLGVRLFDRTTRSCQLTPRGLSLVNHAVRVFAATSDLKLGVGDRDIIAGVVRLGVVDTIAMTSLAEIVSQVQSRLPLVDLVIDVNLSDTLVGKLTSGLLDLACVVAHSVAPGLATERLCDPEFAWFAGPALPIPGGRLTAEVLAQTPLLLHSGSQQANYLAPWLHRIAAYPKRVHTCNSLSTLIRLAEAGIGLSVMPVHAVEENLRRGHLVAVPSDLPPFDNPLVLIRHYAAVDPSVASVAAIVSAAAGSDDPSRIVDTGGPGNPNKKPGNGEHRGRNGNNRHALDEAQSDQDHRDRRQPDRGQPDRGQPDRGRPKGIKSARIQSAKRPPTRNDAAADYPPRSQP
jgi:DNA-binding transcriptional LysR family regulator